MCGKRPSWQAAMRSESPLSRGTQSLATWALSRGRLRESYENESCGGGVGSMMKVKICVVQKWQGAQVSREKRNEDIQPGFI